MLFKSGNVAFSKVESVPDNDDFPISTSTALASLLLDGYNTSLSEAIASDRLYRNRDLDGFDDLPGHSFTMNARVLLYRWMACLVPRV